MTCRITVNDGVNAPVVIDTDSGAYEQGVDFQTAEGGLDILRFLDGHAEMQFRWRREQFTITGTGRVPQGLRYLDYSKQLAVTIETGLAPLGKSCFSRGPTENWDMTGGEVSWSLDCVSV